MTLRKKFALAFAAVALVTVAVTVLLSYDATRSLIKVNTEQNFRALIDSVSAETSLTPAQFTQPTSGIAQKVMTSRQVVAQVMDAAGHVVARDPEQPLLPLASPGLSTSVKSGEQAQASLEFGGEQYTVVTVSFGGSRGAVQLAMRTTETEHLLSDLSQLTVLVGAGVFVLAAGAGWLTARRVTRRLARLTASAERVASTGLEVSVAVAGRDEVGRLGEAFDVMLAQLREARANQRRLVEDAGHELRTPLTSLRTNVAVLRRFAELPPESQQRLIDDLAGETRELSELVEQLVALATETDVPEEPDQVHLAALAERVARGVRRRSGREIHVTAPDAVIMGYPKALDRALTNLVENAAKFAPDGVIEIVARPDRIAVLDRGPGVGDDAARIFDRFYRATSARAMPGSGLGLAIVREVAANHGGSTFAHDRAGGGAEIGFTIHAQLLPSLE